MAIPIINNWESYFHHPDEGLGSSYERVILNDILLEIVKRYQIDSVLESPAFGFTGLSGINLMELARQGIRISLEDHDASRLELIRGLWKQAQLPLDSRFNPDYTSWTIPINPSG